MKSVRQLYSNVLFSFRKNSSKALIAFFALLILCSLAYSAFFSLVLLFSKIPFMIYPLMYLFTFALLCVFFGLDILIYLLHTNQRAVIGHIFYFFRDYKRMFLVALIYSGAFLILGVLSFLPYSFFADKALDSEIFSLMLQNDVDAVLNLNHGFSLSFYLSILLWFVLFAFFLFCFAFLPQLLFENPKEKLFKIMSKCLKDVFSNFGRLFALCLRTCLVPLCVLICCLVLIFLSKKVEFLKNIALFASFVYQIAAIYIFLLFFFALSAFYSELSSPSAFTIEYQDVTDNDSKTDKTEIFLLPYDSQSSEKTDTNPDETDSSCNDEGSK